DILQGNGAGAFAGHRRHAAGGFFAPRQHGQNVVAHNGKFLVDVAPAAFTNAGEYHHRQYANAHGQQLHQGTEALAQQSPEAETQQISRADHAPLRWLLSAVLLQSSLTIRPSTMRTRRWARLPSAAS